MHVAKLGRIVRRTGGWTMACAAVFAAVAVATPSARAHGGVRLGSASGFRPSSERPSMRHLFITFHPRFIIAPPMSVITDRRRYTGVTITGYVIIVIAAVAIDPTIHAGLPIKFAPTAFASGYDSRSSPCRAGFPVCRQAGSTSTRNGCSSTLAINKTSHCFCSATSNV